MTNTIDGREVLTPGQVAAMFGVDRKTVSRWAQARRIGSTRTLGGHHRYYRDEVERLFNESCSTEIPRDGKTCGHRKGTAAGYQQHLAHRDVPCAECVAAERARQAAASAARRAVAQ